MAESEHPTADQQLLMSALGLPIARIYVNGFTIAQSYSDVALVAQTNGSPSAIINMSFTTAKSLAVELTQLVQRFETMTKHEIMTISDVAQRTMQR